MKQLNVNSICTILTNISKIINFFLVFNCYRLKIIIINEIQFAAYNKATNVQVYLKAHKTVVTFVPVRRGKP